MRVWPLALLLAALHVARAEERAKSVAVLAPVLPTVSLSGSTDGSGKMSAGLSIRTAPTENSTVLIEPAASITTNNGLGNLFSLSSGQVGTSKPWTAGLQATWWWLQPGRSESKSLAAYRDLLMVETKERIVAACRKRCKDHPDGNGCTDLRKQKPDTPIFEIPTPVIDACDDHNERASLNEKWNEESNRVKRNALATLPTYFVSAAVDVGAQNFSYLVSQGDPNSPMTNVLASTTSTKTNVEAGILGGKVWMNGATLELPLVVSESWSASSDSAHWCVPVGVVPRPGAPTPTTDPAESCNDATLNGPTQTIEYKLRFMAGYIDIAKQFWRAAAGPFVDIKTEDGRGTTVNLALTAPVYVAFAKLAKDNTNIYNGLVRLTPTVGAFHDDGGWHSSIMVNLELLGNISLFGNHARAWF